MYRRISANLAALSRSVSGNSFPEDALSQVKALDRLDFQKIDDGQIEQDQ
jgi:hypothetical protein